MNETPLPLAEACARTPCRSCGHEGLDPVLDLGMMPHSDGLVPADRVNEPEPLYPLQVGMCPDCSLVQILHSVPPETLFQDDYPYYSSHSDALLAHSRENALGLIDSRGLTKDSFVVELASNDGYLLKNFVEQGVPVLGIDPAAGPAKEAEEKGVPTIVDFFGRDLAKKVLAEHGPADVILGNNVLAHVPDLNGFVAGIATLLADDGVVSIECPYVRDLVDHNEFDTIYHEHLCYYSVTALDKLFARHGLTLSRVFRLPIHGGSLRLHVTKGEPQEESVKTLLREEREAGLDTLAYYQGFADRVDGVRTKMRDIVLSLRGEGKRVAAYGAAAKGAIMLNACGLDRAVIDFCVDRNPHKQGKNMPGVKVPILAPEALVERMPEYAVILPWNFKEEIMRQQAEYRNKGGKFIVPIPEPAVV